MYKPFFEFASGLAHPLTVPKGWTEKVFAHIAEVEEVLGLKPIQYLDNPPRWEQSRFDGVENAVLCSVAERHNDWVRRVWYSLENASKKPPQDGETLTPETARQFWYALSFIDVPYERWTREYYINRILYLYEVMRGRECEGTTFDADPLTIEQAEAVILIFSEYLSNDDVRLAVPRGWDTITDEYDWCENCGAIAFEDSPCSREDCPLREDEEEAENEE